MQSADINMNVGLLYYAAQHEVILPSCSPMLWLLSENVISHQTNTTLISSPSYENV